MKSHSQKAFMSYTIRHEIFFLTNSMSSIIDRQQVSKLSNKFKLAKNDVKGRTQWSHTVKKLSCHTQSDMRWFKHLIIIYLTFDVNKNENEFQT